MDFTRSRSLPVRSGNTHGSPIGLAKPALLFKIHPYRISASKSSDRSCPKCDDLHQSTCDCDRASKISSSGAMEKDHAEEEIEWNVNHVHEIPSYFCIERSHEYYDDLSPSEISKRISDCFGTMQEMISVTYDNDQATANVESTDKTKPDYCKFQVRLFKASDAPSILVECQRRTGCCIKFHAMAMKVLCAARGCEYKEECFHAYTVGKDVLEQCRLKSLPVSLETTDEEGNRVDLYCDRGCGDECDCGQYTYLPQEHDCLSEVNQGTF